MHKHLLAVAISAALSAPIIATAEVTPAPATPKTTIKVDVPANASKDSEPEAAQTFQGAWQGRFSGDSLGNIKVTVTEDGIAKVNCVIDDSKREFNLEGPVQPSGDVTAIDKSFGPSGIKVRFKGKLTRAGTATGTWENPFFRLKGTWEATRIADK